MKTIGQRGASAVEFAIILPILSLLVIGIIDFGLLLYNKAVLTNASREGARAGIVQSTPRVSVPAIESVVISYCQNNLIDFSGVTPKAVTFTPPPVSCTAFGDDLTVKVSFSDTLLLLPNIMRLFGASLTNPMQIEATTTMRCE